MTRFTVESVRGGQLDGEMSNLLHNAAGVGDIVMMSVPYGDVVLDGGGGALVHRRRRLCQPGRL